jgi:hypothetical protein
VLPVPSVLTLFTCLKVGKGDAKPGFRLYRGMKQQDPVDRVTASLVRV